jgi:hypothetical protein
MRFDNIDNVFGQTHWHMSYRSIASLREQRFIKMILNDSAMACVVSSVQLVPVQQYVLQTHRDRGIFGLWTHLHTATVGCSTGRLISSDVYCSFIDCSSPNCARSQYRTTQSHSCALFCQMEWVNPITSSRGLTQHSIQPQQIAHEKYNSHCGRCT